NPVVAGQPAVQRSILDVPRHLLRPDQRPLDLRVVDGRIVAAGGESDPVAGLAEQVARRFLEAPGRDAEFEDLFTHFLYTWLGSNNLTPTTSTPSGVTLRK